LHRATLFSLEFFDNFFPRVFNEITHINKIPIFSLNLVYYLLDIEYASRKNMVEEARVNEITKT